jgi:hypothetical protein
MSATTLTDDEEGRAFHQRRLSLAGLCMFLLAGGSWYRRHLRLRAQS